MDEIPVILSSPADDNRRQSELDCLRLPDTNNRAKSIEFLCRDGEELLKPPDEGGGGGTPGLLMIDPCGVAGSERRLSSHELRFQESLQRLDVPEWFRKNERKNSADGFLLGRRRTEPSGWEAAKSAATSVASSLQSSRAASPTRTNSTRSRRSCRCLSPTRDNLLSPDSTRDNSPIHTPVCDCHLTTTTSTTRKSSAPLRHHVSSASASSYHHRWGSVGSRGGGVTSMSSRTGSHRSGSVSPCSNFSTGASSQQASPMNRLAAPAKPYLGWRSSEKLCDGPAAPLVVSVVVSSAATTTTTTHNGAEDDADDDDRHHDHHRLFQQPAPPVRIYLTPAERLAQSLLPPRVPPSERPTVIVVAGQDDDSNDNVRRKSNAAVNASVDGSASREDEEGDDEELVVVKSEVSVLSATPSFDQPSSPAKSDASTPETTIEIMPRVRITAAAGDTTPAGGDGEDMEQMPPSPPPPLSDEPMDEDSAEAAEERLTWSPGPDLPPPISPRLSKGSIHAEDAAHVMMTTHTTAEGGSPLRRTSEIAAEEGGEYLLRATLEDGHAHSCTRPTTLSMTCAGNPEDDPQLSSSGGIMRGPPRASSRAESTASAASSRPRSPRVWVESSFVGVKPIQSPDTPVGDVTSFVFDTQGVETPTTADSSLELVPGIRVLSTASSSASSHHHHPTAALISDSVKRRSYENELEPLLPGSRGSGKATLTPSPEPFFFEDLEIKIMETDLHRDSPFASTPASLGDAISPTGATAGNSVASISSPGPAGLIAMSHILIQCRNSKCPNGCHIEEAQKLYKTCKNCHTYYCSRECRRAHKPKHQKHCMQLRASSLLTDLMHQIRDVPECFLQLSKLARQGYLSRGAGCVKLFFQTVDELQDFLNTFKTDSNGGMQPVYTPVTDLMPEEMGPDNYRALVDLCGNYNPETKLVLYAAACVWSEIPTADSVKFERLLIVKCGKMKLSPLLSPKQQNASTRRERHRSRSHIPVNPLQLRQEAIITQDVEEQETIIFVSPLGFGNERSGRILCRDAIIAQLTDHGVDLAVEFPDVDRRLGAYVERNESFGHVIFYPRDAETSKFFMCIVMLEVDPDRFGNLPADINNVKVVSIDKM